MSASQGRPSRMDIVIDRAGVALRELSGLLPRSIRASQRVEGMTSGVGCRARTFGEVLLDEVALTGVTILGGSPTELTSPLSAISAAADEMLSLGVSGALVEPQRLQVGELRFRRIGPLRYERLTFTQDPELPPTLRAAGFGRPETAVAYLYRHPSAVRPWVIFIHGARQGSPFDLLSSGAQRFFELGFNVAAPVQPGHGPRRAKNVTYPGMDPLENVAATIRAVSEIRALTRWLTSQSPSVTVVGTSLGSPIAALVASLEPSVRAVAAIVPILDLHQLMAHHLDRNGERGRKIAQQLRSPEVTALWSVVDPLAVEPEAPPSHRLVVGALADQMAQPRPAEQLHNHWRGRAYWHTGSHVGHAFSRKVRQETEQFILAQR